MSDEIIIYSIFSDEDKESNDETSPLETIVKPELKTVTESSINIVTSKKKKKKPKAQSSTTVNGSQHKPISFQAEKKAQTNHQKASTEKKLLAPKPLPKSNKRKFTDEDDISSKSSPHNSKKMKLKQKRNSHKKNNKLESNSNELSENRLKAFGINPKKFKNKLKYGSKNQQGKNHNKKGFKNNKNV